MTEEKEKRYRGKQSGIRKAEVPGIQRFPVFSAMKKKEKMSDNHVS